MADYLVTDTELTNVANAIRTKANIETELEWPSGYINTIQSLIADGIDEDLIAANIRDGVNIAGIDGYLVERPGWVSENDIAFWNYAYFNREIDWAQILPLLPYDKNTNKCIIMIPNVFYDQNGTRIFGNNRLLFSAAASSTFHVYGYYDEILDRYYLKANINDTDTTIFYCTSYNTEYWVNDTIPVPAIYNEYKFPLMLIPYNNLESIFQQAGIDTSKLVSGSSLSFGHYYKTISTPQSIFTNGIFDVSYLETINVNVPQPSGTKTIDSLSYQAYNIDVRDYKNLSIPSSAFGSITPSDIRNNTSILGVHGTLVPCPNWLPHGEFYYSEWHAIYFNTQVLPIFSGLEPPDYLKEVGEILSTDEDFPSFGKFYCIQQNSDNEEFAIFYYGYTGEITSESQPRIIPIYATKYLELSYNNISFTANSGWNINELNIPHKDDTSIRNIAFYDGDTDLKLISGRPYAFGNFSVPQPISEWYVQRKFTWNKIYFNKNYLISNLIQRISNLTYQNNYYYLLAAANFPGQALHVIFILQDINRYLIGHAIFPIDNNPINFSITPLWASESGSYSIDVESIHTVINISTPGWQGSNLNLSQDITFSCANDEAESIMQDLFAGTPIAFGDFTKNPNPNTTIRITQNGTYTWEELSQYANIIIDIPTNSSSENATLENDTLIFDGNTSISGNTLILDADANVSGDTLVFTGSSDPAVSGDDIIFDGDEAVSSDILALDGTVEGDTIMI